LNAGRSSLWLGMLALVLVTSGCGGGGGDDPISRGRAVYLANCVVCHNENPRLAGPIGPPIAGSPPELVRSKVMRSEYPPGYTPKRPTHAMVPLPHLEPKLGDLAAYLGSVHAPSIP
jgi:mono/diheme cytochrome c family protein